MTHIVSPLSQCVSLEKRDRFLDYISKIAPVTSATEPNCHGYAWFRSAEDNDTVPSHWLRGFEIYASKDASHIEHRASDEYKTFRKAVGEEGLLGKPSDLQFWHPTSIGFINKGTPKTFSVRSADSRPQYIVTEEFKAEKGQKERIFERLRNMAAVAWKDEGVLAFWVLGRVGPDGTVVPEVDEDSLYVFLLCKDREASTGFCESGTRADWEGIRQLSLDRRRTTWVESGIGFIGR